MSHSNLVNRISCRLFRISRKATYASEDDKFEKFKRFTEPNSWWIVSLARRIGDTRFIGRIGVPLKILIKQPHDHQ